MSFKMEIVGVDKGIKNLDKYLTASYAELTKVVVSSSEAIKQEARKNVPVDTGALRSSIRRKTMKRKTDILAEIRAFGDLKRGKSYAAYVEFGTYKMAAQPYLFPAAEKIKPGFIKGVRRAMRRTRI